MLLDVQTEIWERQIAPLLAPRDLLSLAVAHRSLGAGALSEDGVWRACLRASMNAGADGGEGGEPAGRRPPGRSWTYRALITAIAGGALRGESSAQLATHAVDVSSQDRPGERMEHVLYESVCSSGTEHDRGLCPCANGSIPCYWSSRCDVSPVVSRARTVEQRAPPVRARRKRAACRAPPARLRRVSLTRMCFRPCACVYLVAAMMKTAASG